MTRRGFLLGKFLPPHEGHLFLCRFAQALCDQLSVLVCSLPDDPIPGPLRRDWMAQLLPGVRILYHDQVVPQTPDEHPDFWAIWRRLIRIAHPEPIDIVFASEAYGHRLAAELGARFVPADPLREAVPISATLIRDNPRAHWHHIPWAVRPWFLRRVVLFGPESSGKTTLARHLAQALNTVHVPEYGRTYTEQFGTEVDANGLVRIAHGHRAASQALAPRAQGLLIEDTDPLLTQVWSEMLLGAVPAGVVAAAEPYADLYLLTTAADVPFIDDGTRYFEAQATRERFDALCRQALIDRGLDYAVIDGPWEGRFPKALSAIEARFGVHP